MMSDALVRAREELGSIDARLIACMLPVGLLLRAHVDATALLIVEYAPHEGLNATRWALAIARELLDAVAQLERDITAARVPRGTQGGRTMTDHTPHDQHRRPADTPVTETKHDPRSTDRTAAATATATEGSTKRLVRSELGDGTYREITPAEWSAGQWEEVPNAGTEGSVYRRKADAATPAAGAKTPPPTD